MADVDQLSDGDNDGSVSPTPATVPKKRGRPSNPKKPAAVVASGRGKGRPSKANALPKKSAKASEDSGEEEGTASDGGSPLPNGDAAESAVTKGRGRPAKLGKPKLSHKIEYTGKGRGRPKKPIKADEGDEDEEAEDDVEDDADSDEKKVAKKPRAKKGKKTVGRPKKPKNSDDESSDDDKEKRPVGRPNSGGVNLNIVRTGRGQGRPKMASKRARDDSENGSDNGPKKRGRPATSGKAAPPYQPTGKPRGRPKAAGAYKETENEKESQDEDDEEAASKDDEEVASKDDEEVASKDAEEEEPSKDVEGSADEEDSKKVDSESDDEA